jgi:hypothetical protein
VTIRNPTTRLAAFVVGGAAFVAGSMQAFRGVPLIFEAGGRVRPIFAPIGIGVGIVLLIIALSPTKWWFGR